MKGLSLPVNILIIVAVAIIVLIAVISMFFPAMRGGGNTVTLDVAQSQACRSLVVAWNCETTADLNQIVVYDYDANRNGQVNELADSLMALCINDYQTSDPAECRRICGCAV